MQSKVKTDEMPLIPKSSEDEGIQRRLWIEIPVCCLVSLQMPVFFVLAVVGSVVDLLKALGETIVYGSPYHGWKSLKTWNFTRMALTFFFIPFAWIGMMLGIEKVDADIVWVVYPAKSSHLDLFQPALGYFRWCYNGRYGFKHLIGVRWGGAIASIVRGNLRGCVCAVRVHFGLWLSVEMAIKQLIASSLICLIR